MDPELACIWIVIGKGKSKWLIGQLYREHMILGDKSSASVERQKERWNRILERVSLTEKYENVIVIGDFNVNIDPDNMENDQLNSDLKDGLLDFFPLAGLKQTVTKCTRQVNDRKLRGY